MPSKVINGDPILDSHEGTLTIDLRDGTCRVFNWDYVTSYYHMTPEEVADFLEDDDDDDQG